MEPEALCLQVVRPYVSACANEAILRSVCLQLLAYIFTPLFIYFRPEIGLTATTER